MKILTFFLKPKKGMKLEFNDADFLNNYDKNSVQKRKLDSSNSSFTMCIYEKIPNSKDFPRFDFASTNDYINFLPLSNQTIYLFS